MRKRTLKFGVVALTALSAAAPFVATQAAYADYAPSSGDIVGVGSDTLQYMTDFMADGDAYSDAGYNNLGNKNKLVSIDATADGTARLAFGADGANGLGNGNTTAFCAPTTGGTAGTGNTGTTTTPCVLNPTVFLRAGTQPVQRPNGSGSGVKALENDIIVHGATETINFSRASAAQAPPAVIGSCGTSTVPCLDSIVLGTDTLPMLAASTTNAVALSAAQLKTIYSANTGACVTWNQVGGTSTDAILPIIPQAGSGTRSFFLGQIGLTGVGSCVQTGEENDPTAIATAATPADAIEPISQGRLNLYLGNNGAGANQGIGGYFLDPTCSYEANTSACGTGSGSTYKPNALAPAVKTLTGTPSDGTALFDPSRNLYMYFRNSDLTSTKGFQPGSTENWLNTLFYDPCLSGQTGCVTLTNQEGQSVQYGPAGQPFIDSSQGYTTILDAGVTPVDPDAAGNFKAGGA